LEDLAFTQSIESSTSDLISAAICRKSKKIVTLMSIKYPPYSLEGNQNQVKNFQLSQRKGGKKTR
jgi:hypothetical protein